ncbi:MAG: hypothetical protein Q9217_002716 [Psora testacea]
MEDFLERPEWSISNFGDEFDTCATHDYDTTLGLRADDLADRCSDPDMRDKLEVEWEKLLAPRVFLPFHRREEKLEEKRPFHHWLVPDVTVDRVNEYKPLVKLWSGGSDDLDSAFQLLYIIDIIRFWAIYAYKPIIGTCLSRLQAIKAGESPTPLEDTLWKSQIALNPANTPFFFKSRSSFEALLNSFWAKKALEPEPLQRASDYDSLLPPGSRSMPNSRRSSRARSQGDAAFVCRTRGIDEMEKFNWILDRDPGYGEILLVRVDRSGKRQSPIVFFDSSQLDENLDDEDIQSILEDERQRHDPDVRPRYRESKLFEPLESLLDLQVLLADIDRAYEKWCTCGPPYNKYSPPMIQCNNALCKLGWYHMRCVGVGEDDVPDYWLCEDCGEISEKDRQDNDYLDLEYDEYHEASSYRTYRTRSLMRAWLQHAWPDPDAICREFRKITLNLDVTETDSYKLVVSLHTQDVLTLTPAITFSKHSLYHITAAKLLDMAPRKINVFLSSFHGLGLPSTSNLVSPADLSLTGLRNSILDILPPVDTRLIITTTSNKEISPSEAPLSSFLAGDNDTFLQLRLSVPLYGGKGGFGSQLRAAGGRMSSKRKKKQDENNSSNRNLDGRRLRTVKEAKALAEYLALKPEMEKKEKEARRKRWQQVVDLAERNQEELRNSSRGKVDGKWVEDKEEAGERTREAVSAAMKSGEYHDNLTDPSRGGFVQTAELISRSREGEGKEPLRHSAASSPSMPDITPTRSYAGFDEDDGFMSDSEDEHMGHEDEAVGQVKGKGNA